MTNTTNTYPISGAKAMKPNQETFFVRTVIVAPNGDVEVFNNYGWSCIPAIGADLESKGFVGYELYKMNHVGSRAYSRTTESGTEVACLFNM